MKFPIGTFLWALTLIAVCEKVDVYRTGYAIEQLRAEKKQAQHEQRALELELVRVTAPEQFEGVGLTKLGMMRPRYVQVVLVGLRLKPVPPWGQGALPGWHFVTL